MVGVRSKVGLRQVFGRDQTCISSGFLTLVWRPSWWKQRTTEVLMGVCAQCEYCWDKECSRRVLAGIVMEREVQARDLKRGTVGRAEQL